MELAKFEQLGQKVESLLTRVEEITRTKDELTRLLGEKEEELKALKENLVVFEQERDQVRIKVDELYRIDQCIPGEV